MAYFSMPTRFWEIATGSLIFILLKKETFIGSKLNKLPPLPIFLAIIFIMFLPQSFSSILTIGVVILTSALIYCLREGRAKL